MIMLLMVDIGYTHFISTNIYIMVNITRNFFEFYLFAHFLQMSLGTFSEKNCHNKASNYV